MGARDIDSDIGQRSEDRWTANEASTASGMKELVETMVRAMVDDVDAVRVDEVIGGHSAVIELHVARHDLSKLIGKRGVHAQALRTIVAAAGGKLKRRYILEIVEDD